MPHRLLYIPPHQQLKKHTDIKMKNASAAKYFTTFTTTRHVASCE